MPDPGPALDGEGATVLGGVQGKPLRAAAPRSAVALRATLDPASAP